MAVFTEVFAEADALHALPRPRAAAALRGIQGGIENTNYFASTDQGEYVLTLFERLSLEQLPFYLHLMKHLAQHGIPVPDPEADARGDILHTVRGKPAAVVNKLPGEQRLAPGPVRTAPGRRDAGAHAPGAAATTAGSQPNLRGLAWWNETVPVVLPFLDTERAALLRDELRLPEPLSRRRSRRCRAGAIHADLFRDNVMFEARRGSPASSTSTSPASTAGCSTWRCA